MPSKDDEARAQAELVRRIKEQGGSFYELMHGDWGKALRPQATRIDGTLLWLWKDGEHYVAYQHQYPVDGNGDPLVLGEPAAWAVLRPSQPRSTQPAAPGEGRE